MKINAKLTFLVGAEVTRIEIHDEDSGTLFFRGELSPENLSRCLSRQAYVPMDSANINNTDRVGKKQEISKIEFPCDLTKADYRTKTITASEQSLPFIPVGWLSDGYFGSQDSFFEKDGKTFARTTIRRWVDK